MCSFVTESCPKNTKVRYLKTVNIKYERNTGKASDKAKNSISFLLKFTLVVHF